MEGIMWVVAKKQTQSKQDLYFAVKVVWQKLSKRSADLTPTTGLLVISAHVLDPFQRLRLNRKWDDAMDIDSEDETSYTTQYQEAILN